MDNFDFYLNLLLENTDDGITPNTSFELGENGYNYLKIQVDKLNKKANKWGVPPMELKIVKEEYRKEKIIINKLTKEPANPPFNPQIHLEKEVLKKIYTVELNGEPPRVEGYEFVAKVEHTEEGNIINFAPNVQNKDVPEAYRTVVQACDVCKEKRERNNTFILKLLKDDVQRFPDKKSGDFIMVGSGCLKRFLPNTSASTLIDYAEYIENIRNSANEAANMKDSYGGDSSGHSKYIESYEVALYIAAAYLASGKYVSRSKAEQLRINSTVSDALNAMYFYPTIDVPKNDIVNKLTDTSFKNQCENLVKEFNDWKKTKDFNSDAIAKPEYASLYKNLAVISKLDIINKSNISYFGAMFGMFLYDKGKTSKPTEPKAIEPMDYLGTIGQKTTMKVEVKKIKGFESKFGYGSVYSMVGETSDGKKGNITYFTGTDFDLAEGEKAEITATIKNHQINSFTKKPETLITRAKVIKKL